MPFFFDHYPYTNFHNINLDWVLEAVKAWGALVEENNIKFHNLEEAMNSFRTALLSEWNTFHDETQNEINQFEIWTQNYLQNLDVQEEINTKLDEMLSSGVLSPYFAPYIQSDVSDWLQNNITPTSPAIDASLTISGAGADAKITGDKITDINNCIGDNVIEWLDGYAIQGSSGALIPDSAQSVATVNVIGGSYISGYTRGGTGDSRGYAFYNVNGKYISGGYNSGSSSYDYNFNIDVPDKATIIKITCNTSYKNAFKAITNNLINGVSSNTNRISNAENITSYNNTQINDLVGLKQWVNIDNFELGTLFVTQGQLSGSNNNKRVRLKLDKIQFLNKGDVFGLTNYDTFRFMVFYSSDNTTWTQGTWQTVDYTLPSNGYYSFLIDDTSGTTYNNAETLFNLITFKCYNSYIESTNRNINKLKLATGNKFCHFSFDDVQYCMMDLQTNEGTYTSIFDNPFFAMLKEIHENYGAVFSLYLFLDNSMSGISGYPTSFTSEFSSNSDWLKFGLHQGSTNYESTTAQTALSDYETFTQNIINICGSANSIDRCPRLANFKGNINSILAMRDTDGGIVGLLSAYDDRDSYYLDSDTSAYLFKNGKYIDYEHQITFYRTIKTFEVANPNIELPILNSLSGYNRNSYAIMMMHEYAIYGSDYTLVTSMKDRIIYACNWVNENGYAWDYPMHRIL